jgi:drug/metabolite transporter (DMT)-like permease
LPPFRYFKDTKETRKFAPNMAKSNENTIRQGVWGAIAISFAAVLWGLDGVVLTPRLYNLDVGFVVMVLHLIPFLLMTLFLPYKYRNFKVLRRSEWVSLFLVALAGGAIGTMAIVKALFLVNFQKLTIVVLLQKLQPVFAIALATLILREKLKPVFYFWAFIAIMAGYFLTFGWNLPHVEGGKNYIFASLYSLLAAFAFGSSTVFSKKALGALSFPLATYLRYGLTTFIMLPVVLLSGKMGQFFEATPFNWFIFLVISLTTGSGAIFLYYFGLKRVKASVSTICELFFPLSAILFDYLFNGAVLTAIQWVSASVMFFSIINLNRMKSY